MSWFFPTILLVTSLWLVTSSDPPPLVMPGHVTIGVLAELRQKAPLGDGTPKDSQGTCVGPIKSWALQEVAALEWALVTINNQSKNHFPIGLKVYDSCGDHDRIIRQATTLLKENEQTNSPLLGIIALGAPALVEVTVSFLHAYDIPLVTTHAPTTKNLAADNVFTTAPHLYAQIQAVLSVISRQRRHIGILEREPRLGIVSGCEQALRGFKEQAKKAGIEIHSELRSNPDDDRDKLPEKTLEFIKSQVGFQGTVIVLLETPTVNALAEGIFGQLLKRSQTRWIFSILDGESADGELNVAKMHEVFPGAVVVEPHSPLLPGLNKHLENALRTNHSVVAPLLPLLQEQKEPCPPDTLPEAAGKLCASSGKAEAGNFLSGVRATAAVKAVSSLAAAFRLVQIERCPTEGWCSQALIDNAIKDMLEGLMKLSYTPQGNSDHIRYTADGRLVSSFTISLVTAFGLHQVGKFREDTGVVWTHPLPGMRDPSKDKTGKESSFHFVTPGENAGKAFSSSSDLSKRGRNLAFDYLQIQEYPHDEGIIKEILMTHQDYITRTWALSVLIISCIGIFSALYIGVYVCVKYCDGTITGPQHFGGLLLCAVIFVYLSCILYILPPTPVVCRFRTFVPNLALTLCFGVLVVKGMHLRAIVLVGLGGEVSQGNFWFTLVLMMGVETTLLHIGHQEVLDVTPDLLVELDASGMRHCKRDKLASLVTKHYLLLLLLFSVVLGFANRRINRNHNEARWLLIFSGLSIPVLGIWTIVTHFAPQCLEPPTNCGAYIIFATLILVLIFFPKVRVIANRSKDFRPKRLSAAPSLSTIFTQLDYPPHPLRPPLPFCDSPHKPTYPPSDMTMRSSCHSDITLKTPCTFDITNLNIRSWRDHMQESPCLQRPPAPPPPPPLIKNPLYSGSFDSCYP